jgi:hypothetical protein
MRTSALAPEVQAALPTFFVIGAAKAGTTSLHEYLARHPEIAMTSNKEPMCFHPPDWITRLERYTRLYDRPAPVRGESSTAYAAFPWAPDVPDRVRATVPDARIVYLVRDPIERALSHYAQHVWDRPRVRPFDELMDDLEHPVNSTVWCSRYATQIERWLERFGDERVLVLDQRDLMRERAATLRRVLTFLEVDPDFTCDAWTAHHNVSADHRAPTALARRLGRIGRAASRAPVTRRLFTREVPRPQLRPDQRDRLVALLAPEAERLRALTGLPLDHWSV